MATSAARSQPATAAAVWSRAHAQVTKRYPLLSAQPFMPLPAPRGPRPYRLELAEVLPPSSIEAIDAAGHLRFHSVGDSGGVPDPAPQHAVAAAMAGELGGPDPARFFYHLGDVVYGYGEEAGYGPQFLEPYAGYRAPIFAVPGNHDADLEPDARARSLDAFVGHFCAPGALRTSFRREICQPNVYWTLRHRWTTIVGLYTNVPEGGRIAEDQIEWLVGELSEAPKDAVLILALHHCLYSTDEIHGSNLALADLLDGAFARAGRAPDLVLSGHVHSYQRFSRRYGDRVIPHVVAGTGGVNNLQEIAPGVPDLPASFQGLPGVTLEAYQDTSWGYLTVTCGPGGAEVSYSTVERGVATPFDAFSVPVATG